MLISIFFVLHLLSGSPFQEPEEDSNEKATTPCHPQYIVPDEIATAINEADCDKNKAKRITFDGSKPKIMKMVHPCIKFKNRPCKPKEDKVKKPCMSTSGSKDAGNNGKTNSAQKPCVSKPNNGSVQKPCASEENKNSGNKGGSNAPANGNSGNKNSGNKGGSNAPANGNSGNKNSGNKEGSNTPANGNSSPPSTKNGVTQQRKPKDANAPKDANKEKKPCVSKPNNGSVQKPCTSNGNKNSGNKGDTRGNGSVQKPCASNGNKKPGNKGDTNVQNPSSPSAQDDMPKTIVKHMTKKDKCGSKLDANTEEACKKLGRAWCEVAETFVNLSAKRDGLAEWSNTKKLSEALLGDATNVTYECRERECFISRDKETGSGYKMYQRSSIRCWHAGDGTAFSGFNNVNDVVSKMVEHHEETGDINWKNVFENVDMKLEDLASSQSNDNYNVMAL